MLWSLNNLRPNWNARVKVILSHVCVFLAYFDTSFLLFIAKPSENYFTGFENILAILLWSS